MNLDRKLMAYAAGAVAAGLAGAESADAAIVYSNGFNINLNEAKTVNFDNSGVEEFSIGHERETVDGTPNPNTDRVILKEPDNGSHGEAYVIDSNNNVLPAALAAGTLIGPDSEFNNQFSGNTRNEIVDEDFDNNRVKDEFYQTNFTVDNVVGNTEYVGVRFKVNNTGEDRYGYIGIDITNADDLTGVVTGFAYDDTGAAIAAGAVPEPAGLALLAIGSLGLLRRKRA